MKKFTFRYIPNNSKVYVISKAVNPQALTTKGIFQSMVYTEPFMGADDMIRNAVLAYQDESVCCMMLNLMKEEKEMKDVESKELDLIDLKGYCDSIAMPLTVLLSVHCDIESKSENREVYFYEGRTRPDNEFTFKKLKL